MTRTLVVYASTHGHTAKIAARVAETVGGADVREVGAAGDVSPRDYDVVVVGASIHGGSHQEEAVRWAREHAVTLNELSSAFFSVCLAAAEDSDESRAATRRYIDDFLDDTGWAPGRTITFAGALQYLEYDFMTRLLMRLLMKHGHHPTDVAQDYDYTDWAAVDRFGRDCASMA